MVTHKGWDCKDDLKLLRYGDPKVRLSVIHVTKSKDLIKKGLIKTKK